MLSQEKGFDFTDGALELLTSSEAPKTVDSRNLSRTVEPTQARPCMTCTEKKIPHRHWWIDMFKYIHKIQTCMVVKNKAVKPWGWLDNYINKSMLTLWDVSFKYFSTAGIPNCLRTLYSVRSTLCDLSLSLYTLVFGIFMQPFSRFIFSSQKCVNVVRMTQLL